MDRSTLKLFRRRYIPDEFKELSSDEILLLTDDLMITKWKTLHPRMDFSGAVSAFFINEGWKISRIVDNEGNLTYWYCDIIDIIKDEEANSITYEDLLFDVVVFPNGKYRVLDSDEAAQAFEEGLITKEQLISALRSMHELLEVVYHDRFDRLQAIIEKYC